MAYKRLQKPDVVFGHLERTAKVAFAEPSREPDPKVMARLNQCLLMVSLLIGMKIMLGRTFKFLGRFPG